MKQARALYADNTGSGVSSMFHAEIAKACANGGELPEELADLFVLVRTPPGSAVEWRLEYLKASDGGGR